MSFADQFAKGQRIAGDLLDTYREAKLRAGLADVANAQPEEGAVFTPDQTAQVQQAQAQGLQVIPTADGYSVSNPNSPDPAATQAVQDVAPAGRQYSFLGQTSDTPFTPDQVRAIRARAQADVVGRYNPAAGMRLANDAAGLESLPAKTQADQTGYQLNAARNSANLGLVDQQAANAGKKETIEGANLDAAQARQPLENTTKFNQALVTSTLEGAKVEDLPNTLATARAKGAMSAADTSIAAAAKLYEITQAGDVQGAVSYLNAVGKSGAVPGLPKTEIASVAVAEDPKLGHVLQALDAKGNTVYSISANQLRFAHMAAGGDKGELKTVKPGETLVQVGKSGAAKQVFTAPETAGSKAAKMGPLQRDTNYVMGAMGLTEPQAIAYLSSAKTMSRAQFILKSSNDMIALGKKPTDADIDGFGAMYDRASQLPGGSMRANSTAKPAGVTAPTQPATNWQDWVQP